MGVSSMTLIFQGRYGRASQKGHVGLCQGKSDMKNARAAGLQVKGENGREHCNHSALQLAQPVLPVQPAGQGSGSDQTRPDRLALGASPLWAAGRRMLFATASRFCCSSSLAWAGIEGWKYSF